MTSHEREEQEQPRDTTNYERAKQQLSDAAETDLTDDETDRLLRWAQVHATLAVADALRATASGTFVDLRDAQVQDDDLSDRRRQR
jgi:hypothetical protein